jgi:hypothetical protein
MKSCVVFFQNYSINNEISNLNLHRLQKDLGFTSDPTMDVKKFFIQTISVQIFVIYASTSMPI